MMTSATEQFRSLAADVARWWWNWRGNRAARAELNRLDPETAAAIARDVGASRDELRALAGKWPDSADLLSRRMIALHLDPKQIARAQPAVSNDLKKLCSLCFEKRHCAHDLDSGATDTAWRHYCPNTFTLTSLGAQCATGVNKSEDR